MRTRRPAVPALVCTVLLCLACPGLARSVLAQPQGRALGVDYILLIDASYSMLLDPRNPGRAAEEVGIIIDEFVARTGRRPNIAELNLRSGLFKHVIAVADRLLQSAADETTVAIYVFNDRIVHQLVLELGAGNRPQVTQFLSTIAVGGDGTAIFSSVNEALDRVETLRLKSNLSRRSTIFLFTDGKENRENISIDEILKRFDLLRSDEDHFLFWRYFYPQVETSPAAPEMPALLEKLRQSGVEFHDLSDLDAVFEKESISVEPEAVAVEIPAEGGAVSSELLLHVSEERTEQMDLNLDADFPGAADHGIQIRATPEEIALNARNGTATLSFSLNVEREDEASAPAEDRQYEGSIRITSPQVLLIEPSRVPVTLTVAGKGRKAKVTRFPPFAAANVAAAEAPAPVVKATPLPHASCASMGFGWLALLTVFLAYAVMRSGRWFHVFTARGPRVLVLSDQDEILDRLVTLLKGMGEAARVARSLPRARGLLEHGDFRLVILGPQFHPHASELEQLSAALCVKATNQPEANPAARLLDLGRSEAALRQALERWLS